MGYSCKYGMSLVGDDGNKSQQIYFLFIAGYYSNIQMCDAHILHRLQLIFDRLTNES